MTETLRVWIVDCDKMGRLRSDTYPLAAEHDPNKEVSVIWWEGGRDD